MVNQVILQRASDPKEINFEEFYDELTLRAFIKERGKDPDVVAPKEKQEE
jgi:hypothetical protein